MSKMDQREVDLEALRQLYISLGYGAKITKVWIDEAETIERPLTPEQ
jgi:hypothetical protein